MKDLKILKGAKLLSKSEQRMIKGGKEACDADHACNDPWDYCQYYNQYSGICVQARPEI